MTTYRLLTLTILLGLISGGCPYFGGLKTPSMMTTSKQASSEGGERCFCKLQGNVDDCGCTIEAIDNFNARHVRPLLSSLLKYSYFRYFKVNMRKECPFWVDDGRCALRDCAVEECTENDVPVGLKGKIPSEADSKYGREANEKKRKKVPFGPVPGPPTDEPGAGGDVEPMSCKEERNLSAVDSSLSAEDKEAFKEWKKHDDKKEYFCELEGEVEGMHAL